ncbi:hypothetical protein ACF061_00970 [Streptomyces sp. NPDC015220]|uniref:hypothetical protein n=1 Tax=Streptomyces sp. NPDC015220 TaxID=3364947 RepID=UPI0036FEBDA1
MTDQTPVPVPPATSAPTGGLVAHGDPIDIGWQDGTLDARLHLSVRPDMDEVERDQLLADLRDALAPVVPIRQARQEAQS